MSKSNRFSPEVRERAVRLMHEWRRSRNRSDGGLKEVGAQFGVHPETLRNWVRQTERDEGKRAGPSTSDRERLRQLERENRELKRANEILRTASAYFAQAELGRRRK